MRKIFRYLALFIFIIVQNNVAASHCRDHSESESSSQSESDCPDAEHVWHSLKKGNKKFVKDPVYEEERQELVGGQNPPCIVLSCSDSRVPPEIIFDQGLGELFVTRVAGEVADNVVIDSIEYAVTHYCASLLVVMGHTDCGAVIGALKHLRENNGEIDFERGHLNAVLIPIEKAILEAGIDIYACDALELSIRANIRYVANRLISKSKGIREAIECGTLSIIGAEYDLKTGKVEELFRYPECLHDH